MGSSYVYRSGDLFGARYYFERRGEGIPMHKHEDKDRQHNVIVLRGSVRVRTAEESITLTPASPIWSVRDAREHEIVALEDCTIILNLNLYGAPEVFKNEHDDTFAGPVYFVGDPDGN